MDNKIFRTPLPDENTTIEQVNFQSKGKTPRYIKIIAKKLGSLPEWHLGYEHQGKSWLFVDEITIN